MHVHLNQEALTPRFPAIPACCFFVGSIRYTVTAVAAVGFTCYHGDDAQQNPSDPAHTSPRYLAACPADFKNAADMTKYLSNTNPTTNTPRQEIRNLAASSMRVAIDSTPAAAIAKESAKTPGRRFI